MDESEVLPVAPTVAIAPRNAFIMSSLLQDVIRRGTGAAAMRLGRGDLAGKTGTTNDNRDAWFAGFQKTRVAVAWMGYDQPRSLGSGETGGGTALPIWIRYMDEVLKGVAEMPPLPPAGIVSHAIDPKTGAPLPDGQGVLEYFFQEYAPVPAPLPGSPPVPGAVTAAPQPFGIQPVAPPGPGI